jgi:oligopeptide/dipeptide ABC transporter ATP-binding protein
MYAGRIVEQADVDTTFHAPRMPYTLGLLGSLPRMDVERPVRLTPILGTPPSLVNLPDGCPFAPRCPLARDACEASEPTLVDVATGHRAACHFHAELIGRSSTDVFSTTSVDAALPASGDLPQPNAPVVTGGAA